MARNKAKAQGTEWETDLRRRLQYALGMGWDVTRMADGGSLDEGDLLCRHLGTGYGFVIEAKNMAQANIHVEVEKAVKAAGTRPAAVAWKRLARKSGNQKRSQVGKPIVCMDLDEFAILLKKAGS